MRRMNINMPKLPLRPQPKRKPLKPRSLSEFICSTDQPVASIVIDVPGKSKKLEVAIGMNDLMSALELLGDE